MICWDGYIIGMNSEDTTTTIKDFLNYNISCPMCSHSLSTRLFSFAPRESEYIDNRLIIYKNLMSLHRRGENYNIGYSFSPDNEFNIEFFDSNFIIYNEVSLSKIKAFKELHKNLNNISNNFRFYRLCKSCCQYSYTSNNFHFDFEDQKISSVYPAVEYYSVSKPYNDKYKIYKITNDFIKSKSFIEFTIRDSVIEYYNNPWNSSSYWYLGTELIELPMMNLANQSSEEILNKLELLITFS